MTRCTHGDKSSWQHLPLISFDLGAAADSQHAQRGTSSDLPTARSAPNSTGSAGVMAFTAIQGRLQHLQRLGFNARRKIRRLMKAGAG
jgi:hypothetical protein